MLLLRLSTHETATMQFRTFYLLVIYVKVNMPTKIMMLQEEYNATDLNRRQSVICEVSQGFFEPNLDGSCLKGMKLTPNNCCSSAVSCSPCGPGFKRRNASCHSDCLKCNAGHFSKETDNYKCLSCTKCELLHREEKFPCNMRKDTVCGKCLKGYYEEVDQVTHEVLPSCTKCCDDNRDPMCLTYFAYLQAQKSVPVKSSHEVTLNMSDEEGLPIISVLLILSILISVTIVILWRNRILEQLPFLFRKGIKTLQNKGAALYNTRKHEGRQYEIISEESGPDIPDTSRTSQTNLSDNLDSDTELQVSFNTIKYESSMLDHR